METIIPNAARIWGINNTVIGKGHQVVGPEGQGWGILYPAEAVKAILRDSNRFRNAEIDEWPSDVEVKVPPGTDDREWVVDHARSRGLAYKTVVHRTPHYTTLWNPPLGENCQYGQMEWARNGELINEDAPNALVDVKLSRL
jgi:hypothetical protein